MELTKEQQAELAKPFSPDQVSWRAQGKPTPNTRVQVVAYLDARDVQDRLDSAVGAGNWTFDWTPIVTNATGLLVAKGTITIFGVSKSDVGDASSIEGTKGTVSDAFKRAAVMWGIGRELYSLGKQDALLDARGHITAPELKRLRALLTGTPVQAAQESAQDAAAETQAHPTASPAASQERLMTKDELKTAFARFGYVGTGWVEIACQVTGKTKEALTKPGFSADDLQKMQHRLKLLQNGQARVEAQKQAGAA